MKSCFFYLAIAAASCASHLAATVLKTGDPAPKIRVASWAQGPGVKAFEGDKVYIVEFWASWCGPCVEAIPHLNDIYKKNKAKGLVVIGSNVGEDKAAVSTFIKTMGGKMSYPVAVDDPADGGWMGKNWLTAAGESGIPCAFVVNKKGKIAYIGHPMELKESLLASLLAEPSAKAADVTKAAAPLAVPSAKVNGLVSRAHAQIQAGKLAEAETSLRELQAELPANLGYLGGLLELDLLLAKDQPAEAMTLAKFLREDYGKDPAVLASVAAHLISPPQAAAPLQAAAEKIATPLSTSAGAGQGPALTTLARIAFLRGDKAKALELQKQALPLMPPADQAAATAALKSYQ